MCNKMKKIGFTRIDARLDNVIINGQEVIKVIDHVNSLRQEYDIPVKFFIGLKEYDLLNSFLDHIKDIDFPQYSEWTSTPEVISILNS